MFKLQHNCTYLISWQSNAQNFPNSASKFQMFKLDLEKAVEPEIKLSTSVGSPKKAREFQKNIYFCFSDSTQDFDCVEHRKLWKLLQEMGISDYLTCLLRNLYSGQETTVRTRNGKTDWFQFGKRLCQVCILSPCLLNFYAEYIMQNARLDEVQARIKIVVRNISADDTPPLRQKPKWN